MADTLGTRIRFYRKRLNLTQYELGLRIGASASAISMYENDERLPQVDTIADLCDALNVAMGALIPEYGSNPDEKISVENRNERILLLGYRRASDIDRHIFELLAMKYVDFIDTDRDWLYGNEEMEFIKDED